MTQVPKAVRQLADTPTTGAHQIQHTHREKTSQSANVPFFNALARLLDNRPTALCILRKARCCACTVSPCRVALQMCRHTSILRHQGEEGNIQGREVLIIIRAAPSIPVRYMRTGKDMRKPAMLATPLSAAGSGRLGS